MIKGYKAMNADMTCRGFQFEVGCEYKAKTVKVCREGFHYCENLFGVYEFYPKSETTVVCEIEDHGDTEKEDGKSCTNHIKIIRRLSDKELLAAWIKKTNSGYGNSGDRNSGDRNSGYGNSGDRNSGDRNSGDWNSGYGNSGDRNSGDWNSGYRNSGYFNTSTPLYFFNKPSYVGYTQELENKIRSINVKPILQWIGETQMTEKEKAENPSYETTGGFLRKTERMDWSKLTDEDKDFIKSLPNFDDEVFQKISNGVSLMGRKA